MKSFVSVLAVLLPIMLGPSGFAEQTASCDSVAWHHLRKASESGSIKEFLAFCRSLQGLTTAQREEILCGENSQQLFLNFESGLLERPINDSMLLTYEKLIGVANNNAGLGEALDTEFSRFFATHTHECLEAMEKIKDERSLDTLAKSATFVEESGKKIIEYISNHVLTSKNYSKAFQRYR